MSTASSYNRLAVNRESNEVRFAPMKAKSRNCSRGFSFIEVMAAMVILSISLIVLMGTQSRSMALVERAQTLDYATTLANAKIVELTQEANTKGILSLKEEDSGDFD